MNLRRLCLLLHRYLGLAMAAFLLLASVTGAFLPYYHALDHLANPALHRPKPHAPDAVPLSPVALRNRLEASVPGIHVPYVPLDTPPGDAVEFFVRPAPAPTQASGQASPKPRPLENDQYFLDPYSGEILGGRMRGDLRQGAKNILPFLYRLHYSLNLGPVGRTIFGCIALVWTIDCFVGAYLTFPPRQRGGTEGATAGGGWWSRWGRSWLVKTGSLFKTTFTWHRASGLWLWGMLFVFAWSAVGLNLGEVYFPAMNAVFGMKEGPFETLPRLPAPRWTHALSWDDAVLRGRELIESEARERNLTIDREVGLSYLPAYGMFRYIVRSSRDVSEKYANTAIWFHADTGQRVAFETPTGEATGNTIHTWIVALHFADVGGHPYRIFVCGLGVLTTILTVSGVYLWWVKRAARRAAARLPVPSASTPSVPEAAPQ